MRENGLNCRRKRSFKKTTDSRHGMRKYPNLLKGAKITKINQAVVGDITAYDDGSGNDLYLAQLMDVYSRRVIGRAVSDRIDTELVMTALAEARRVRGSLRGCIHHTDTDSRYCSAEYTGALIAEGMRISMCVDNVYENAHAESLNKTIKRQEINVSAYAGKVDSADRIFRFIDLYNEYRPHSALGGLSPVMFERMETSRKN
jgi:transposase InsO family protein